MATANTPKPRHLRMCRRCDLPRMVSPEHSEACTWHPKNRGGPGGPLGDSGQLRTRIDHAIRTIASWRHSDTATAEIGGGISCLIDLEAVTQAVCAALGIDYARELKRAERTARHVADEISRAQAEIPSVASR